MVFLLVLRGRVADIVLAHVFRRASARVVNPALSCLNKCPLQNSIAILDILGSASSPARAGAEEKSYSTLRLLQILGASCSYPFDGLTERWLFSQRLQSHDFGERRYSAILDDLNHFQEVSLDL